MESFLCANRITNDIRAGYDECAAACMQQSCVQEQFEVMTSEAIFSESFLNLMSEPLNMSHLDVKHNLVGFEVYYRDMAEELVNNTIAYGPFDLFCDIGGALGLMLGASIATVVESFDFFVRYRYGKLRILRQTESQL